MSHSQVEDRFGQQKIEKTEGRMKQKKWTQTEDDQLVPFREKWLEEHQTTYGMWDVMAAKMTGKIKNRI